MALIECRECKKQISDQAAACPGCGARPLKEPKSYAWLWTILILFGVFVVYSWARSNEPEVVAMRQDRQAYELCLQSMKENPGNPIAAGACAMLRDKFIAKHRREP